MKTNLRKRLSSNIGVAVIAMLLGSNIGYALDNYEMLTHNLSYAGVASTGGSGGDGERVVNTIPETGSTAGWGTDTSGAWVFSYELCSLAEYELHAVDAWEQREGSYTFTQSPWEVSLYGGATIKSTDFKPAKPGETTVLTYSYERPCCMSATMSCCSFKHKNGSARKINKAISIY